MEQCCFFCLCFAIEKFCFFCVLLGKETNMLTRVYCLMSHNTSSLLWSVIIILDSKKCNILFWHILIPTRRKRKVMKT